MEGKKYGSRILLEINILSISFRGVYVIDLTEMGAQTRCCLTPHR